ncbi:MAG TPA: hypothetical protein VGB96_13655, partial [Archangium sp.]
LDAAAARDLRARIQNGRQQADAQAKARDEALAKAREPVNMPPGSSFPPPAPPPPPKAEAPTDAGTPGDGPRVGTPATELSSGFSSCFVKGDPLEVRGRGLRDRWELANRAECRQRYGSLQDQILIIDDGKVFALAPKSSIMELPADGGFPSDGGR